MLVNFETLTAEARALAPDQRRRLIAQLVSLQQQQDFPDHARKMAEKIDDRSEDRWFTEEEARKELGLADGGT